MPYSVTALAQAAVAGKIKPAFIQGVTYNPGWAPFPVGLPSGEFATDECANEIAALLGAKVIKLQARGTWLGGVPNSSPYFNIPLENFISFEGMPGEPVGHVMVVNAADIIANACTPYNFMNRELACEEVLANQIPGASMSQAAADALNPPNPIASWPPQQPIWYKLES